MKIAFFTDSYYPQTNGVVVFVSALAGELSKKNKVILFAPGKKAFRKEKKSENLTIYWIPASPFPFYKGYRMTHPHYRKLKKVLEREKPDIVHIHAPVLLGLMGLYLSKKLSIPTIATYHTHLPDYVPHLFGGSMHPVLESLGKYPVKTLVRYFYSMASCSTAPTRELVRELKSYGLENVRYFPNGIKLDKKKPSKKTVEEFAGKYKIPLSKKIVLYLGRISFEKRIEILLKAFSRVETDDYFLLVVGSGPHLGQLRWLSSKLKIKNIGFTGFIEKRFLSAAYSIADVFASPSSSETFGLTFLEAMSRGVPCIGVKSLGAKELITHKKDGLLVKPESDIAFSRALKKMLENDRSRKRMGEKAKEKSKKYGLGNVVKKAENLYRETTGPEKTGF